ncbi:polyprenyl synthetase family protein [Streptomyces sp. TRM70308]|uniref:polyprenyl synthetase family protein n=1 Tax=Streptomyces sp. TRM70308 TaxID=3131932 RepID=UPI003CFFC27D
MSSPPRDGARILAEAATDVAPLILSRVGGLPPTVRHVAGLHFGWWDDDGTALDAPPVPKSVRPALVLLACRAVGGDARDALDAAVAVELVHNASLLHDDVIDGDPLRRGRPSLWAAKGLPAAILVGDALFFAAVQTLGEAPHAAVTVPALLESVQTLIEGEYRDCVQEAAVGVREDDVLVVAAAKTGELLACACALGAVAGGAGPERVAALRAFGRHLGIAFQCVDDVLGIWGDERATGKPATSDVRARKTSLPVAVAMAGRSPQAGELRALYRQPGPLDDADCRRAKELIESTGAREATLARARQHAAEALRHLALAAPRPGPAADLTALMELVVHRDR